MKCFKLPNQDKEILKKLAFPMINLRLGRQLKKIITSTKIKFTFLSVRFS
jgi:hypothetical protein